MEQLLETGEAIPQGTPSEVSRIEARDMAFVTLKNQSLDTG